MDECFLADDRVADLGDQLAKGFAVGFDFLGELFNARRAVSVLAAWVGGVADVISEFLKQCSTNRKDKGRISGGKGPGRW